MTAVGVIATKDIYGTSIYPVTRVMISTLGPVFFLFALIISLFYSGELVWRERDSRIDEIIDSSAMPNWAYLPPKLLAMTLVLVSTLFLSVLADVAVQLFKGYTNLELSKYFAWFLFPYTIEYLLLAVLAMFFQVLAPQKFVGWGLMLLYLIGYLVLAGMGFDHMLYLYDSGPDVPLSDMNGQGQFWIGRAWLQLYWSSFAVILLGLSHLLWRRGVTVGLKSRLSMAPQRLKGATGAVIACGLVVFIASGGFIFYNTNVLNEYVSKTDHEQREVAYEKNFGHCPAKDSLPLLM